jgi:hypothetical protein
VIDQPFDPAFADECRALLRDISSGAVTLTLDRPVGYSGVEFYTAPNGWRIGVFNDCGEWDYIDFVETQDGRFIDFDQMYDHARDLADYVPSEQEQDEKWGWA